MSINLNGVNETSKLLESIDLMARSTSGKPAGNIGMINGRVVKFNTHWTERLFSSTTQEMLDASASMRKVLVNAINQIYGYNGMKTTPLIMKLGSDKKLLDRSVVAEVIDKIRKDDVVGELSIDASQFFALSSKDRKTDFATVKKALEEEKELEGAAGKDRTTTDRILNSIPSEGDNRLFEDVGSENGENEDDSRSVAESVVGNDILDEDDEDEVIKPEIPLKTDYDVANLGGSAKDSEISAEVKKYIDENHPKDSRCAITLSLNLYSQKSETLGRADPEDRNLYLKFLKTMDSKINRAPVTSMAWDGMSLVNRLAPNKTLNVGSSSMGQKVGKDLYDLFQSVGASILADRNQTIKRPTFNNPVQLPEIGKLGKDAWIRVPNRENLQDRLMNGYTKEGKAISDFESEAPDTEMTWSKLLRLQLLRDGVGTGHSFDEFLQGIATALNTYSKESQNLNVASESPEKPQKSDYLKFLQEVRAVIVTFATMSDEDKNEYAVGVKDLKPRGKTLKQDFLQDIRKALDSHKSDVKTGKFRDGVYNDLAGWLDKVAEDLDEAGEFYQEKRY